MPTVQNDDYSCGFWAVEILLQIVLDGVSLKDGVKVAFEVEEYRKYLSQLVQTRYLGIDSTSRRSQMVAQQASAIAPKEVKNDGLARKEVKVPRARKGEDILDEGKSGVSRTTQKTLRAKLRTNTALYAT